MRPADQLAAFVHEGLTAGRSRTEIADALARAGWTASEISDALEAWAETDFVPPVPRPRPFVSAREAFLYALMFIALTMTAWHLSALSFHLIDRWIPDPFETEGTAYAVRQMRWSIAFLIVFFPLFLIMSGRTAQATRRDPAQRRSAVRRWFGYVTLLLAAIGLLGDLIYVIYALLNGDLTIRFAAKAAVVAVIAGLIFVYFRKETEEVGNET